jgi:transcriptional regulator with XRE-family HTH domain
LGELNESRWFTLTVNGNFFILLKTGEVDLSNNEGASLMTTVGQRIREIRKSRNLTQRELADRVGINFTYLSRVENDRLDDEQTPREETLQRIAKALDADPDELLLLARRIPDAYRDRILSRPGVFRKLLNLSDSDLQELVERMDLESGRSKSR